MMKNVMAKAWDIARAAQKKFGGSVKSYLSLALKAAWAATKKVVLELSTNKKSKTWVARILGTDPVMKFERKFLDYDVDFAGDQVYRLDNGVYDVCERGNRRYVVVSNGKHFRIESGEVLAYIV